MNTKKENNYQSDFESFVKLIKAIQNDPVINKKTIKILKMDSYPRRIVLSKWLEQLRLRNASEELLYALSCLYDDSIVQKTLSLIGRSK